MAADRASRYCLCTSHPRISHCRRYPGHRWQMQLLGTEIQLLVSSSFPSPMGRLCKRIFGPRAGGRPGREACFSPTGAQCLVSLSSPTEVPGFAQRPINRRRKSARRLGGVCPGTRGTRPARWATFASKRSNGPHRQSPANGAGLEVTTAMPYSSGRV
jgi:hypothetical protein